MKVVTKDKLLLFQIFKRWKYSVNILYLMNLFVIKIIQTQTNTKYKSESSKLGCDSSWLIWLKGSE